jgi:hypothetical protein
MTYPGGNRRIDRVLGDEFLAGLKDRPLEEVRAMRDDAEQEETDLSYLRRLLQGRMDILHAEKDRRAGRGPGGSLVDRLPGILSDESGGPGAPRGAPRGSGRHVTIEPSRVDAHRRYVEALVADSDLSDPGRLDDDTLTRLGDVLEREEAEVSVKRRSVQAVMDACMAEITRRYRDGDADVADLLPSETN